MNDEDKTLQAAIDWIKTMQSGQKIKSTDLQIKFKIGYCRAGRIYDELINQGYLNRDFKNLGAVIP